MGIPELISRHVWAISRNFNQFRGILSMLYCTFTCPIKSIISIISTVLHILSIISLVKPGPPELEEGDEEKEEEEKKHVVTLQMDLHKKT